jgi:hypothetical protein
MNCPAVCWTERIELSFVVVTAPACTFVAYKYLAMGRFTTLCCTRRHVLPVILLLQPRETLQSPTLLSPSAMMRVSRATCVQVASLQPRAVMLLNHLHSRACAAHVCASVRHPTLLPARSCLPLTRACYTAGIDARSINIVPSSLRITVRRDMRHWHCLPTSRQDSSMKSKPCTAIGVHSTLTVPDHTVLHLQLTCTSRRRC